MASALELQSQVVFSQNVALKFIRKYFQVDAILFLSRNQSYLISTLILERRIKMFLMLFKEYYYYIQILINETLSSRLR